MGRGMCLETIVGGNRKPPPGVRNPSRERGCRGEKRGRSDSLGGTEEITILLFGLWVLLFSTMGFGVFGERFGGVLLEA